MLPALVVSLRCMAVKRLTLTPFVTDVRRISLFLYISILLVSPPDSALCFHHISYRQTRGRGLRITPGGSVVWCWGLLSGVLGARVAAPWCGAGDSLVGCWGLLSGCWGLLSGVVGARLTLAAPWCGAGDSSVGWWGHA